MAALTEANRRRVHREWNQDLSNRRDQLGAVTKVDLKAAVDAVDNWIDSNDGSFNSALPLPARTELTGRQKAHLFVYVISRRFDVT